MVSAIGQREGAYNERVELIGTATVALLTLTTSWMSSGSLSSPSCDYVNVDGQCRPGDDYDPSEGGLDLPCRDGTITHSTHRTGACSHHGGLA